MAPRNDETAWMIPQEASPEDVLPAQSEEVDADFEEAKGGIDPFLQGTTDFCSNVFGALFGKTKVCEHCNAKLYNSETRTKEVNGEIKTYFHPECKTARVALEEQKKVLHTELMTYFEIRAEMTRQEEIERMTAILEAERYAEAQRALEAVPAPAPKKEGLLQRLFGGCRSNRAVV